MRLYVDIQSADEKSNNYAQHGFCLQLSRSSHDNVEGVPPTVIAVA